MSIDKQRTFETLIFDMDGVVINSEMLYFNATKKLFKKYGKELNYEELAPLLSGMHFEEGAVLIKEKYDFPLMADALMLERQLLVDAEYSTRLTYVAGFENFFKRVVTAGLKTCIATSSNDHLLAVAIQKLGLDKKFGTNIFKASDVGNVSKPNPALFLYAAQSMGTSPDKCFVIEDAPKGILAAKNAGMFCIGITTSFPKDLLSHADMVVDSFDEIDFEGLQ